MKKATAGLIGVLFVTLFASNVWAQPGLRIDLGGHGFGFSVSDGRSGFSTFSYNYYRPYPYYSGYYSKRPYLGWGGYRGHHHRGHKYWNHRRHHHHHKGYHYGNQRRYKRGDPGHRRGGHHRKSHHRRFWVR